ncbi:LutC/YkgG family protein [Rivibacter subsaxonicus]|uniref:L-lactate dehydrogenase complex protein LldG n=1 Tax=Rivibacter subsaxonicus TaxID=457575 RepID=A0A4Q7VD15_9BURK|nr:lactate utilization protein [Rivibacter subsaxonicus]RZT93744.1 L-lactate dehydrogenase complex protein LldG [Rivibacter subsaxonicus]
MSSPPDTAEARLRILERIRSRQRRPAQFKPAEELAAQEWLRSHPRGPLPAVDADRVAHFTRRAKELSSTVERIGSAAEAPAALARYLDASGLSRRGVCYDELLPLDWAGAGIALEARPPRDEDLLGVTGCFCAIAETGSLVFASGRATPASSHLLPETHVVLVGAQRVVAHQEDAFDLMRRELGQIPRGFNTVSGPSRTGDIEQTIVLGAHGPYRVHVLIVDAG